jgi:putative membrane protein
MMWGPYGMGYGFMGWMPFIGIFFWLFILFLVVAAVRGWRGHLMGPCMMGHGMTGHGMERRSPGLDVLEERYARGEINREEYLQKKQDILGRGSS